MALLTACKFLRALLSLKVSWSNPRQPRSVAASSQNVDDQSLDSNPRVALPSIELACWQEDFFPALGTIKGTCHCTT
jgi:hypothetical protein